MDRGAWLAMVNGIDCRESDRAERFHLGLKMSAHLKILEDSVSQGGVYVCVCVCVCVCVLVTQSCLWPHRLKSTRLFCPWDSPGKNTWVGCHFLLKKKKKEEVGMWHCQFKECSKLNRYSIGSNNTTFPSQWEIWSYPAMTIWQPRTSVDSFQTWRGKDGTWKPWRISTWTD